MVMTTDLHFSKFSNPSASLWFRPTDETSGILSARFDLPEVPAAPPSFEVGGKEDNADAENG